MLATIGLLAMCAGVAVGIVTVAVPRVSAPVPLTTFLRYAASAGVLSIGSTLMYLIHASGGGRAALVVADATMVFSPAVMCVGVRGFARTPRRVATAGAAICALGVGTSTALTDDATALVIKAAVLLVVCGSCALAAVISVAIPSRPARTIAAAMGGYALYSGARALVGAVAGWDSPVASSLFSAEVATAVAIAAVLACGAAIIMMIHPSVRLADDGPRELAVIVIGDARLLAQAYGNERLRALVDELRAAARALDDRSVDVRHGVATALPSALSTLEHQMQHAFGWSPEEIALLAEPANPRFRSVGD